MLSKKENFFETIQGGKPDRFVKQYEATTVVPGDPVNFFVRGDRYPGMPPMYDAWGTHVFWPAEDPGPVPDANEKILHDIEDWENIVKIPDLIANCSAEELWGPYIERAMKVDRGETLLTMLAPTGVFERMHFLMGFEDALCNLMLEPELMSDLAMAIGEYRYNGFKLMIDNVHPDAILSHDDWGTKTNLFCQPEIWREIIKPAYVKPYDFIHDSGVLLIHHSDSFCEPIVEDMIDLHIDIWQGVLPQNDIVSLQKKFNGRIAFQGGIDAAVVDKPGATEEEIRENVRHCCETYATGGYFIPSITYGGPGTINKSVDPIIDDEIDRCSKEFFGN